jgi:hypothetical protein
MKMSGLDEQHIDFPSCNACGKMWYWVIKESNIRDIRMTGVCLNTDKYIARHRNPKINGRRKIKVEYFDMINKLKCGSCGSYASEIQKASIIEIAKRIFKRKNK